jgi:hypothetical protein
MPHNRLVHHAAHDLVVKLLAKRKALDAADNREWFDAVYRATVDAIENFERSVENEAARMNPTQKMQ